MLPVVACVFVKGHVPYTAEYVVRLQRMVAQHLPRPHRFVVLTDQPLVVRSAETLIVPTPEPGVFAWWAKLHLFSRAFDVLAGDGARVLYLDLDVVITGDLGPLLDFPAPFALIPDGAPNFKGKGARGVVKRFNSSAMVWNAGEQRSLWSSWRQSVTETLWGDQDWIGQQCPSAELLPAQWFPRLSELKPNDVGLTPQPGQRVILCKKPKNADAARLWHWFEIMWGSA